MRYSVPKEFTIGESLTWTKSFADYPASDGWVVTYYFRGAGTGFNAAGASDGDDHLFEVATATTGAMTAGKYSYQAFAELDGEKVQVDFGEVTVKASLSATLTTATFDGRSAVKIALDAIDALIAGKATLDQQEYTIGNRQLKRYTPTELVKLREHYAALYAQEVRAENAKKGGSLLKTHRVRFRRP